jgi:hypothetical protein
MNISFSRNNLTFRTRGRNMSIERVYGLVVAITIVLLCVAGRAAAAEPVSAEAKRYFTRGLAAVEMARSPVDYDLAIEEFTKARSLAPDWPDVHYNLGLVQDKAGKFRDAAVSLKRYLQLAPDGPDAAAVTNLMTRLEFKAEQAISDEDALNIFGSLGDHSTWQLKGKTPKDSPDFRGMQVSRRDGQRIVITYQISGLDNPVKTQTISVTPHGKTLSFSTLYNLCARSTQSDECPDVSFYSLEIVSRRQVTMTRKRIIAEIKPYMASQVSNQSYEFVRVR